MRGSRQSPYGGATVRVAALASLAAALALSLFGAAADAATVATFADAHFDQGKPSSHVGGAARLTTLGKRAKAPRPIRGKGYHRAFHDNFNRLGSLAWGRGVWYTPGAPAHSIFARKGKLNLVSRRSQGYRDITLTTEAGSRPRTFRQGYFEARMKWTNGKGAWPAFWLYSWRRTNNPDEPQINSYCREHGLPDSRCWNAELDVFEGQGLQPHVFYGTLHRNTNGAYGVPDRTNEPSWRTVRKNLARGFHRYGVLWTARQVKWYLDGHRVMRTRAFDSTDQPMFLLFDMWIGWTHTPDSSTPDELKTQVDYVTVWQR